MNAFPQRVADAFGGDGFAMSASDFPGIPLGLKTKKTNEHTNPSSRLPPAFSPIQPTFASKADHFGFVHEWKDVYRYLSVSIRTARLRSRLRPNNRPAKQAALEKGPWWSNFRPNRPMDALLP